MHGWQCCQAGALGQKGCTAQSIGGRKREQCTTAMCNHVFDRAFIWGTRLVFEKPPQALLYKCSAATFQTPQDKGEMRNGER